MKNLKYKFINLAFILLFSVMPLMSFAQLGTDLGADDNVDYYNGNTSPSSSSSSNLSCSVGQEPTIASIFDYMLCIINRSIIPLIFGLATLLFIWGVVKFVLNTDNESEREKGKEFMIWGIIALTVMITVWGIVNLLGSSFGLDTKYIPSVKP